MEERMEIVFYPDEAEVLIKKGNMSDYGMLHIKPVIDNIVSRIFEKNKKELYE